MPKPPRLCSCGKIVPAEARCECQITNDRARKARHDAKRPSSRDRGYDHEWRKARAEYLIAHPQCRACSKPATLVDHIIPHRGDKRLFWTRSNWQPLCTSCHSRNKQRLERKST